MALRKCEPNKNEKALSKWNIEVAHVEEKIFEWGTIFCEIAS